LAKRNGKIGWLLQYKWSTCAVQLFQPGQLADETTYGIWSRNGLSTGVRDPKVRTFTPQAMFSILSKPTL
jgi:hypothetical protein